MTKRFQQMVLVLSTLVASWLGMQAVHELGHVLGGAITGGRVAKVVWHPLAISRTDFASNPSPLVVVWAGPVFGILAPLFVWAILAGFRVPGAFVVRFFAGFCLIANGVYIGAGSFHHVGDCGEMLRHGSAMWQLWLFGTAATAAGLWLWHRQGQHFGFDASGGNVNPRVTYVTLGIALLLLGLGLLIGGR